MTARVMNGTINGPTLLDVYQHFERATDANGKAVFARLKAETIPQFEQAVGRKVSLRDMAAIPAPINGFDDETMNGFFKDVGKFFKKVGKAVANVVNKVNPILVAGRAAFLSLVRDNSGGMATKLNSKRDKVLEVWTTLGGDKAILKKALDHGAVNGIGALPDPAYYGDGIGILPILATAASSLLQDGSGAAPGPDGQASKPGLLAKVFAIAKPLLGMILKMVGINLDPKEPLAQAVADVPATPETVKVTEAVEQAVQPKPVEQATAVIRQRPMVERQRFDRTLKQTNSGNSNTMLMVGAAAVGIFLLTQNNRR